MKAILQSTIKFLALLAIAASTTVMASEPHESGEGKYCGTLKSFEGEVQIFDYTRTHLGDASFGTKLHCGDWISVDKGKATIEHGDGAGILAAENTFFQITDPQSGENPEHAHLALYRGEFIVSATKKDEIRVVTPNAVARITKGGAFVVYSSASEESQIVGIGATTASLENRFFPEPKMATGFGKVVTFANPVERLLPDEARFVNARELGERLTRLGVDHVVIESLEKAVKAGAKTKMPVTLAVTAKPVPKVAMGGEFSAPPAPSHIVRAPASVGTSMVKKYSASRKRIVSNEPNFALKRQGQEESEKKKLLQALSSMRMDDDSQ